MNPDNCPCHSYLLCFITQLQSRNSNIALNSKFVDLSLKKSLHCFYTRHFLQHRVFQISINTSSYVEWPWNSLHPAAWIATWTSSCYFSYVFCTILVDTWIHSSSGFRFSIILRLHAKYYFLYCTTLQCIVPSWTWMSKTYHSNCSAKWTWCHRKERLSTYPR